MLTTWIFDGKENKHDVYNGENILKKLCESLREHVVKITTFERKKMMPETNEEFESYLSQINCHIRKKKFQH